ncbi:hypothetical protein GCM10020367_21160 [Streptomyces sannanensis]|uniref:Uncharacterized protein n=1 Tax=Streptomyces sannanensis TaxID=285536 RepID=A0ABP6S986_9ACTN
MGRQGRWAISSTAVVLAIAGGITAWLVGSSGNERTVQEQAQRQTDVVIQAHRAGERYGRLLRDKNLKRGLAPMAAVPDEDQCREKWDSAGLAEEYGEKNEYQFVGACTSVPWQD